MYILPIDKIASETRLIHSVNPSHRIHIEGVRDIVRLVNVINESADRYEDLFNQVEKKIDSARATAEEEKNILAAIVAELPEGVLICNTEGQILLYNTRVTQLLIGTAENGSVESVLRTPVRAVSSVSVAPYSVSSTNTSLFMLWGK